MRLPALVKFSVVSPLIPTDRESNTVKRSLPPETIAGTLVAEAPSKSKVIEVLFVPPAPEKRMLSSVLLAAQHAASLLSCSDGTRSSTVDGEILMAITDGVDCWAPVTIDESLETV